jgi:ribonuclease E
MFSTTVTLRSGGYIVINPTEALVSIDVNSGRSTREHNIEDTALKTNLEAADEVARQVRLRDLAGLIVIDFIDMEEHRNNRAVEKRLKDALRNDRARIQVGRISAFGLMEMSRQRMRTGVLESSTMPCPHCSGTGMVRAASSVALLALRAIEEALLQNASFHIHAKTRTEVALYILNQKRLTVRGLEERFGVSVTIGADDSLTGTTHYVLERGEHAPGGGLRVETLAPAADDADDQLDEVTEDELETTGEGGEEEGATTSRSDEQGDDDGGRRGRRKRRRGRGRDREFRGDGAGVSEDTATDAAGEAADSDAEASGNEHREDTTETDGGDRDGRRRRRRGRRGGRRFRREGEGGGDDRQQEAAATAQMADADGAAAVQMTGELEQVVVAEAPAPEEAAPKKRGRRKASETAAEVVAEPESGASSEKPKRGRGKASKAVEPEVTAVAEAVVEAAPVAAKAPMPPPAPEPVIEPEIEDPNRPKRTGWWAKAKKAVTG